MRFKHWIWIGILILFSCKKHHDLYPQTQIGGHACAGLHISSSNYHDNSLEAYNYARSFDKVELIEVDVQLSANGTLWLFHDPQLNEESNGTGAIPQRTDSYLSGLHYNSLEKERLIRLTDLPADLKGICLLIDLKESDGNESGFIDSTLLMDAMKEAKHYFHNGNLGMITNTGRFLSTFKEFGFSVYSNALNASQFLNNPTNSVAEGAVFRNSEISISDVNSVKSFGKQVIIYDVRSPKGIKSALDKSPDYLLTDDIKTTLIEKYK